MKPDEHPEAFEIREPATGFDWDAVEDPVGIVLEELGDAFTRDQAERVWKWHLARGRADTAGDLTLADRVLLWISGSRLDIRDMRADRRPDRSTTDLESLAERRIGLRAAVAIKVMHGYSQMGRLSYRALAQVFRCSHGEVFRLAESFVRSVPQADPKNQEWEEKK